AQQIFRNMVDEDQEEGETAEEIEAEVTHQARLGFCRPGCAAWRRSGALRRPTAGERAGLPRGGADGLAQRLAHPAAGGVSSVTGSSTTSAALIRRLPAFSKLTVTRWPMTD